MILVGKIGREFHIIHTFQSFFERCNVFFNEEERNRSDQIELIDQYLAFERRRNVAVDEPDAVERAFSKLNIVSKRQRNEFRSTQCVSRYF